MEYGIGKRVKENQTGICEALWDCREKNGVEWEMLTETHHTWRVIVHHDVKQFDEDVKTQTSQSA